MSQYQNGVQRGWGTLDPVICLETETRKAQVNKESITTALIDVEKPYDVLRREGLLIILDKLGIKRKNCLSEDRFK